jgi:hypothetical protein
MKLPRSPDSLLFLALIALTVGHLGFRAVRARASVDPAAPSALRVGSALPDLQLRPLTFGGSRESGPTPGGCRLLVAFSSSCVHCHTAAAREAGRPRAGLLPIVYVSDADDEAARDFEADVAPGTLVRYADGALRTLKVRAVPTGFLVSSDNRVRSIFAYVGEEDHSRLRSQCAA